MLVTTPLVIMAPRADGFEAVWGVGRLSRGWLEWRAGDARGIVRADAFGMVPQADRVLRVRVARMPAGTELSVRAITASVLGPEERHESEWKQVRLPDQAAPSARIVVWNDTHQHGDTLRALDEVTPQADLLVWNGDVCNDWKDELSFATTILAPEGRDISANRPLALVVGNHDVRGAWAHQFAQFVATPDGRPYSATRVGPVAVIILHTGEDKPDAHPSFRGRVAFEPLRAEQAAWLRQAIERPEIRDAPFRLVFCHIPLRWKDESPVDYDAGGYDWFSRMSRDAWHDALVAWGAQLVISGHTHEAAFIAADAGFSYAQLVGGGPDRDATSAEAAGWIDISAEPSQLTVTLRDLDGGPRHRISLAPRSGG